MKVFYVIYLPRDANGLAIDAIRLIANGRIKWPAHITVRGPYDSPTDCPDAGRAIPGSRVRVQGTGDFFGPSQNTVFLKCDSPEIRQCWHKPDYDGEYNPHLTLYDGSSREFAEGLLWTLNHWNVAFDFVAGNLDTLVSSKGKDPIHPGSILGNPWVAKVVGANFDPRELATLDDRTRLAVIDRLCGAIK